MYQNSHDSRLSYRRFGEDRQQFRAASRLMSSVDKLFDEHATWSTGGANNRSNRPQNIEDRHPAGGGVA